MVAKRGKRTIKGRRIGQNQHIRGCGLGLRLLDNAHARTVRAVNVHNDHVQRIRSQKGQRRLELGVTVHLVPRRLKRAHNIVTPRSRLKNENPSAAHGIRPLKKAFQGCSPFRDDAFETLKEYRQDPLARF